MPARISCAAVKKINSKIRNKIKGALKDLKKDQPRSASTKLYQAGDLIRQGTKGVWDRSTAIWLAHETTWVSLKLCNQSTMYWPKWQSRTEAMLTKLLHVERRSTSRCK